MSERKMPAFRLVFRDKNKQKYDCATVWPGKFPDSYDVQPVTESTGGQYPKLALAEALARVAARDGWLSLQKVGGKRADAGAQQSDPHAGGGGFDDVPFNRWDQQ